MTIPLILGAVLTLLQHEAAAIATYSHSGGNCRADVNLLLDRTNKPDLKTTLSLIADRTSPSEGIGYNVEARLHHPELTRVRFRVDCLK